MALRQAAPEEPPVGEQIAEFYSELRQQYGNHINQPPEIKLIWAAFLWAIDSDLFMYCVMALVIWYFFPTT